MFKVLKRIAAIAGVTFAAPVLAAAAAPVDPSFPTRAVTIVVPTTPGGTADILARLLSPKLSQMWGQPVVVENKPGAGTLIGSDYVARAKPDGYTLLLTFAELATLPSINKSVKLDVVKDFTRIGRIGSLPVALLTGPSTTFTNAQELITALRANPGKYTYASNGSGSSLQLYTEIFNREAKVDVLHIPYKGALEASMALMAGEVDILVQFASGNVVNHVKGGKMKAMAVASPTRLSTLPDVPAAPEVGLPGFELDAWYGLLGPAGMSPGMVAKLNHDLNEALAMPDIKERLTGINMLVQPGDPKTFDTFFISEYKRWKDVIEQAGINSNQ